MIKPSELIELVGRMKVEMFARLAGLSVEDVVTAIVEDRSREAPGGPSRRSSETAASTKTLRPTTPRKRASKRRKRKPPPRVTRSSTRPSSRRGSARPEATSGPTFREVHAAVDRWLLAEVLEEEGGNISHSSSRLGISRRRLRDRWTEVRGLDARELRRRFKKIRAAEAPPSLDELRAGGTHAEVHDVVDRWLLGEVLAQEDGNISVTAKRLEISRRNLRERWARVRAG